MTGKALISGQAGVAVWLGGESVRSFHLDTPTGIDRSRAEIPRLFGDCTDVIVVEGIDADAVPTQLELRWKKDRCLSLCLLALDPQAESRDLAIAIAEELLAELEVEHFLRHRLFVAPMPETAGLMNAAVSAKGAAPKVAEILQEVGQFQDEIRRCRAAWDAWPVTIFGDESRKEQVAFDLVETGAFYRTARHGEFNHFLLPLHEWPPEYRSPLSELLRTAKSRRPLDNKFVPGAIPLIPPVKRSA